MRNALALCVFAQAIGGSCAAYISLTNLTEGATIEPTDSVVTSELLGQRVSLAAIPMGVADSPVALQGMIRKIKTKLGLIKPSGDEGEEEGEAQKDELTEVLEDPETLYLPTEPAVQDAYPFEFSTNKAPMQDCRNAVIAIPDHQVFSEGNVVQFELCLIHLSQHGTDVPGSIVKQHVTMLLDHCDKIHGGDSISGALFAGEVRTVCVGKEKTECPWLG